MPKVKNSLSPKERSELLRGLQLRFEKHMKRHEGLAWAEVQARIEKRANALWSLSEMERTGGEPDVIGRDGEAFIFCDCAAESPKGRRSLCYDGEALTTRKKFKPVGCATEMAAAMGVELMGEEEYLSLQKLEEFDTKSQSWLNTPDEVRELGGALYGDRRFGRVFIGANGAESYFGARGFRGLLKV